MMLLVSYVALLVFSASALEGRPVQYAAAKDVIHIDGQKNPELIPEYVLWEHGFGGLAIIKQQNMPAALASLRLAPEDLALVWKEAALQKAREDHSASEQRRRREALKAQGVTPQQLSLELQKVILDYRWTVLNARDRLLAALTPEGQAALLAWIEARRAHITASVARADWEFFRQPR
jgi:hypothetical protein